MGEIISPQEAARLLGKSARTLERWRTEGAGPAYIRVGGTVSYRRADIAAFLRASRVEPVGAGRVPREVRR